MTSCMVGFVAGASAAVARPPSIRPMPSAATRGQPLIEARRSGGCAATAGQGKARCVMRILSCLAAVPISLLMLSPDQWLKAQA